MCSSSSSLSLVNSFNDVQQASFVTCCSILVRSSAREPSNSCGVVSTTVKVADVVAWLDAQELGVHADTFKAHAVDGKMLLLLEEQELYQVLNIVSPLHRKKILLGIADLRSSYMSP